MHLSSDNTMIVMSLFIWITPIVFLIIDNVRRHRERVKAELKYEKMYKESRLRMSMHFVMIRLMASHKMEE